MISTKTKFLDTRIYTMFWCTFSFQIQRGNVTEKFKKDVQQISIKKIQTTKQEMPHQYTRQNLRGESTGENASIFYLDYCSEPSGLQVHVDVL